MRRLACAVAAWFLAVPVLPWAWFWERRILQGGRRLDKAELEDARKSGVRYPERVRVLAVARVPNPLGPLFGLLSRFPGFACAHPAGLTLRYGIFAVPPMDRDRCLVAHELVHTMQYERAGGLWGFLWRYIFQCLVDGYAGAAWEEEARWVSGRIGN